jgi:hypothetical protein
MGMGASFRPSEISTANDANVLPVGEFDKRFFAKLAEKVLLAGEI